MNKLLVFTLLFFANSILLYVASLIFPGNIVLGNQYFSSFIATFVAGLLWTLLLWLAILVGEEYKLKSKENVVVGLYYLAINFVTLWVIARIPFISGFGVISFVWVLILALFATLVQWGVWRFVENYQPTKNKKD